MAYLYNTSIYIYFFLIRVAALFNSRAKDFVKGQRGLMQSIENTTFENNEIIWFHCASLGEFEQGRPVIEACKKVFPRHKILLTFFSPSGYEIRKNYELADYVYYLPVDTAKNARKFIRTFRPQIAIFIKYEYWFNYINELSKSKTPLFFVSAIFRKKQHFFKPWGGWFRKQLKKVTWFFVQNEYSSQLLRNIGVFHQEVSGDTRFDRVIEILNDKTQFPLVNEFKQNSKLLVAGSTWPADEMLLLDFMKSQTSDIKLLIAPHKIDTKHINYLLDIFKDFDPVLFDGLKHNNLSSSKVLIINKIGILTILYRFGNFAYVGGGFGVGIHNVLEPAVYGLPVMFGPNYQKFTEAKNLIKIGGGFPIKSADEFIKIMQHLMGDKQFFSNSSQASKNYVLANSGATHLIIEKMKEYIQ